MMNYGYDDVKNNSYKLFCRSLWNTGTKFTRTISVKPSSSSGS